MANWYVRNLNTGHVAPRWKRDGRDLAWCLRFARRMLVDPVRADTAYVIDHGDVPVAVACLLPDGSPTIAVLAEDMREQYRAGGVLDGALAHKARYIAATGTPCPTCDAVPVAAQCV